MIMQQTGLGVILAVFCLFLLPSAQADNLIQPGPELTPEDVVRVQLQALQRNDTPSPDSGIRQTWALAHPNNKALTGPFDRFAAMIRSPGYADLLGHLEHTIAVLDFTETRFNFAIEISTAKGLRIGYVWTVSRVREGDLSGAWMTISVSPPFKLGEDA